MRPQTVPLWLSCSSQKIQNSLIHFTPLKRIVSLIDHSKDQNQNYSDKELNPALSNLWTVCQAEFMNKLVFRMTYNNER